MSQSIVVTVSPRGDTKLETRGFEGSTCRTASRSLEVALGLREHETLTAEFYAVAAATPQQQLENQHP